MIEEPEISRSERLKLAFLGALGGCAFVATFAYAGAYLRWADAQITALRAIIGF